MSGDETGQEGSERVSLSDRIEEACTRFEDAWKAGRRPCIGDFLDLAGEAPFARQELFGELALIDLEYCWRRGCSEPDWPPVSGYPETTTDSNSTPLPGQHLLEHYAARYGQFCPQGEIPTDWIAHEYFVRHLWGDRPQRTEYLERFGSRGGRLEEALRSVDEQLENEFFPRRLGRYELIELLGRGAMGTVCKALHVELGREVAIKTLSPGVPADARAVARFKREMNAMGRLDHPHLVRATDADEIEGTRLLVMEYVDGCDLKELLRRWGPLSFADACELGRQAALGLQCAHDHGLIHRDVKPSNMLLSRDGSLKVADLGLARVHDLRPGDELTLSGTPFGTPDFMAPEQASGNPDVDARCDIYSLGCTFYALLAGRGPFGDAEHSEASAKIRAHIQEPIPPIRQFQPKLPDDIVALLDRMLAKVPAERVATMAEVATTLEPLAAGHDLIGLLKAALSDDMTATKAEGSEEAPSAFVTEASPPVRTRPRGAAAASAGRQQGRRSRKHAVAALCALFLLLAAGGAYWWWSVASEQPVLPLHDPVEVESFGVLHFRKSDNEAIHLGQIGVNTFAAQYDEDVVRVLATVNQPAYLYLIALNPDGKCQLCYPTNGNQSQEKAVKLAFPASKDLYFHLNDDMGQQGFVLVASRNKLPLQLAKEWELGGLPWRQVDQEGVWRFDGKAVEQMRAQRGDLIRLGEQKPFRQVCDYLKEKSGADAVEAMAFPVQRRRG